MFSLNFFGKDEIRRKVFYNRKKYKEKEGISMNIYDRKILMVDDNQELVVMIRRILEQSGYKNVVSAHSAADGFRIFKEEKPELVILDVMLPDGDGFSLFCKMREISFLQKTKIRIGCSDLDWVQMIILQNLFFHRS